MFILKKQLIIVKANNNPHQYALFSGTLILHFDILLQNYNVFKKTILFPQTKINYLEGFFNIFLIVYISRDISLSSKSLFFTMKPIIDCTIMREFQRTTWKAKKAL